MQNLDKGDIKMSNILTLATQRNLKPKIEDVIPHFLDNEELKTALNFIAHLRASKMNPRWAGVHNTWNCNYKGKVICYIRLGAMWLGKADNVKWEISPNLIHIKAYESEIIDENMQNYIWDGLAPYCRSCINTNGLARECAPGTNRTILGRDFIGLCNGMFLSGRHPISFVNPDELALNCIKRLLELEKQART